MYYYDGNNRGSYDVLQKTGDGDIKFIAEVRNVDLVESIIEMLNNNR